MSNPGSRSQTRNPVTKIAASQTKFMKSIPAEFSLSTGSVKRLMISPRDPMAPETNPATPRTMVVACTRLTKAPLGAKPNNLQDSVQGQKGEASDARVQAQVERKRHVQRLVVMVKASDKKDFRNHERELSQMIFMAHLGPVVHFFIERSAVIFAFVRHGIIFQRTCMGMVTLLQASPQRLRRIPFR